MNAPNSLEGNYEEKCDTASSAFQGAKAGIIDNAADENEIYTQIRELISLLPSNNEDTDSYEECMDDLNRACDGLDNIAADTAAAFRQISDNGSFFETKCNYAKEMVTGFIKLNGATVGALGNRTVIYDENGEVTEKFDAVLTAHGCEKAAEFVAFCDAFDIPVLSLTNTTGYAATKCEERHIARNAAKLVYAFANATIPKVNVITGKALGSAYVVMNSKSVGADITICWPDAEIGTMEADMAAKIICDGKDADVVSACAEEYAKLQNSALSAAKRGYVDEIVEPADTRKYVIGAFEMLFTKREERPAKKHGTI